MLTITLPFGSSYFLLGTLLVLSGRFISYSYLFQNTCHTHDPIAHFWQPTNSQNQTPGHLPYSRQAIQPKSRSFSAQPKSLAGHLIQGLSPWTPIPTNPHCQSPLPPATHFMGTLLYLPSYLFISISVHSWLQRKWVHDIPLLQSCQDLTSTQLHMSWSKRLKSMFFKKKEHNPISSL